MKTTKKVFLAGMISAVLAFGFVLVSCSQVFSGTDVIYGKAVKLKLKKSSYSLEYDGKTYKGSATKTSIGGVDFYALTGDVTGIVTVADKKLADIAVTTNDGKWISADLSRSIEGGGISLDDIELIIEEEDD